jgi:cation diffusion facilitator CzcD-associated flavoprotein CzcO
VVEASARKHLESQITDSDLRAKLVPDYPIGCKRVLISDDYYPALARPNVELFTGGIQRVTRDGILTADGRKVNVDAIIFGTGFESLDFLAPLDVVGPGGKRLADAWRHGAEAYLGLTVAGFPNLFVLYGPNTNLGHNSIVFMVECQVGYALGCIQELLASGHGSMDVRRDVMDAYNRDIQRRMHGTVWEAGCHSWYKNEAGKVTNNWPRFTFRYLLETRAPRFGEYVWK